MAQSYPTILLCAFAVQRHRRNAFSENAPGKQIQPEPHRRSFIPQQPLGARPSGGLFIPLVALGKTVSKGDTLGLVVPPIGGGDGSPVISTANGIVIGRNSEGLADEGDALFHITAFDNAGNVEDQIRQPNEDLPDMHEEEDGQPVRYHPFAD